MHIEQKLAEDFRANNVSAIDAIFREKPRLQKKGGYLGGDWLYYAAGECNLDVINYLIALGFDPHAKAKQEGDNPLCAAASAGRLENVNFFLELGVEMDTSNSVRNPLFAACGRDARDIVKLLLSAGIDATVKYTGVNLNGMDAACFAVYNNSPECAKLIVEHLAEGNAQKYNELWADAQKVREKLQW